MRRIIRIFVFALAGLFLVSACYARGSGEINPEEKRIRCEKLDKALGYFEERGIEGNDQIESALLAAGIDPDGNAGEWGLPWGTFGAVFSRAEHLHQYRNELRCGR